jgi:hypothetical protein
MGKDFEKTVSIVHQRLGKSKSPSGRVNRQCMWSGKTTLASVRNGRPPAHRPHRIAQRIDLHDKRIGMTIQQVHGKEIGSPAMRLRR